MRLAPVGTLSKRMFHINNHVWGADLSFQSAFHVGRISEGLYGSMSLKYPNFGEYAPFLGKSQMISLGPSVSLMWACVSAAVYSNHSCCHLSGISNTCAVVYAWWRKEEFSLSPICLMWVTPLSCRCLIRSVDILWALPQPTHGSRPMRTSLPSLMRQVIPSRSRGKVPITAFQILDMFWLVPCCIWI